VHWLHAYINNFMHSDWLLTIVVYKIAAEQFGANILYATPNKRHYLLRDCLQEG